MQRLKNLEAVEVSIVPRGANRRKFLIFKGDDVKMLDFESIMDIELENEQEVDNVLKAEGLSEKAINAIKGALKLLNAFKEELPGDILSKLAGLAGYGYPEPTSKEEPKEEDKEGVKKDGALDIKSLPEDLRPSIERLWKEHQELVKKNEELEALLKAEQEQKLIREFVQKAETELSNFPAKPEELGLLLKSISEKAPEEYQKLEDVLKSANEMLKESNLFRETGRNSSAPGSVEDKLSAMAQEIMKSEPSLSFEQAYVKALYMNPDLYKEYKKDRG